MYPYHPTGFERALRLPDLPPQNSDAPCPLVLANAWRGALAYVCAEDRPFTGMRGIGSYTGDLPIAVVALKGLKASFWRPDWSEAGHPLREQGAEDYGGYEVVGSPWAGNLIKARHAVFTFRDNMFECLVDEVTLVSIERGSIAEAIETMRETVLGGS